jgi:GxxExxY protein
MSNLLLKDEVYAIIGAAMEVYNQLGPGFLEPVYQEAMEIETHERKIPSLSQHEIPIVYKGKRLKKFYVADLLCYDQVIIELKTLDRLTSREVAQLINYLKATGLLVGVLINFGAHPGLEWKRIVLTKDNPFGHPLRKDSPRYQVGISED